MRYRVWLWAVLLAAAALVAVAATPSKVSSTGFLARSGDATMIVDTDPALHRGREKFIPLVVWLGHREAKTLHAGRETFSLLDPSGTTHALPSFPELVKGYSGGLLHADYTRLRQMDVYFQYADMHYLDSRPVSGVSFFPDPGGAQVLYDQVEIPNRTYFRAVLYFPNPAGANAGTYTLLYDDAKSGTKIQLPFTIAWAK